jgi:hypothetical protein
MHRALDVPELHGATETIRIPELQSAPVTRRVLALIDHPAFQRLRTVRQLGPTHLVYPGATHSRFEHSIGVYDTARQYLLSLLRYPEVAESLTEADILCTLIAALLHDVGHYPFAHSLEALHLPGADTPRHEDLGARIIMGRLAALRGERSLASIIEADFGVDPEEVVAMLTQKPKLHARPERRLVATIISSGVDADKADYLERDSLHMGVSYGRNHDRSRFLQALCPNVAHDAIAITDKGRAAAEIFVFSRYVMFSEAYWHHTVRAVSVMVERALDDFQRREAPDMAVLTDVLLSRPDDALLGWFLDRAPEGSQTAALLGAMTGGRRRFYKRLLALNRTFDDINHHDAYERVYHLDRGARARLEGVLADVIGRRLGRHVPPSSVFIDTPPRDKDRTEVVSVVHEDGGRRTELPLSSLSRVVQGIATDFVKVVKKIRVFVAPDVRDLIDAAGAHEELVSSVLAAILAFEPEPDAQQVLL